MELSILKDIVVIFALSTFVNFLFTNIRIPTIIGYLFTGVLAGPHLLGIVSQSHQIELMAEIGVVLLMFSIGMEFSLNHLLKIRRIVFLGGFLQVFLTTLITLFIARFYHLEWKAAFFVGFLTALSSTAVVLKLLQDRSEISSNYGRTVLGILIFQDVILIPMLLFTPILGGETLDIGSKIALMFVKTTVIVALVYVGNRWVMPKVLHWIAMTRNQELFSMFILLICLSVALLTSQFGMSLAFGAFLAGLMISESQYSHNAFGNLIPFKDTFTSFFFVSIGMLLDMHFVFDNIPIILITVTLVIIVKVFVAGGTAFLLGHTFKGTVMVAIALSQVGEFSFILAKMGMNYQILSPFFYQLFLAVAILTMSLAPFAILAANRTANMLLKLPIPKWLREGLFPLHQNDIPELRNHIVIIGKDPRALNLSVMIKRMNLPYVSIVFDPSTVEKRQKKGETFLYGDATNDPILLRAHVDKAEIVVISVGALITSLSIVEKVRNINKRAYILVRTKRVDDIEELYRLGASQVIPEEFETAIELYKRILGKLLLNRRAIDTAVDKVRQDHYGMFREDESFTKHSILNELPNIEIVALKVHPDSAVTNRSLNDLRFRKNYGVTIVAIRRNDEIIEHPDPEIKFLVDDIAYVMGKPEQIAKSVDMFVQDEE